MSSWKHNYLKSDSCQFLDFEKDIPYALNALNRFELIICFRNKIAFYVKTWFPFFWPTKRILSVREVDSHKFITFIVWSHALCMSNHFSWNYFCCLLFSRSWYRWWRRGEVRERRWKTLLSPFAQHHDKPCVCNLFYHTYLEMKLYIDNAISFLRPF